MVEVILLVSAMIMIFLSIIVSKKIKNKNIGLIIALIIMFCGLVLTVSVGVKLNINLEEKKVYENELIIEDVIDHFETTDVFIIKKFESGKNYEKYEVVVDGELIKIIYIDDGSGNKRIVVD